MPVRCYGLILENILRHEEFSAARFKLLTDEIGGGDVALETTDKADVVGSNAHIEGKEGR